MYNSASFESIYNHKYITEIYRTWEFPGGPMVRTQPFHGCGPGSIPGRGTKILQAAAKKKIATREKQQIIYKGIPIRLSADFPAETLQVRKGKNLQPRILYPARLSFRFNGEVKSFTDKQKLREFSITKPALQQMLKELL